MIHYLLILTPLSAAEPIIYTRLNDIDYTFGYAVKVYDNSPIYEIKMNYTMEFWNPYSETISRNVNCAWVWVLQEIDGANESKSVAGEPGVELCEDQESNDFEFEPGVNAFDTTIHYRFGSNVTEFPVKLYFFVDPFGRTLENHFISTIIINGFNDTQLLQQDIPIELNWGSTTETLPTDYPPFMTYIGLFFILPFIKKFCYRLN